jgi:hypothetical protein
MGGANSTLSRTTNNVINQSVSDITKRITNICQTNSSNTQTIRITIGSIKGCSVNFSNIGQTIDTKINNDCTTVVLDTVDIQNDLKNNIEASAEALKKSTFFEVGNNTVADAVNNLINIVDNKMLMESITQDITNSLNNQNIETTIANGIECYPYPDENGKIQQNTVNFSNLTQNAIGSIVLKSLSDNTALFNAVTAFDNTVKASSKAVTEGMFEGIAAVFGSLFIIPILIICLFIYIVKKSSGGLASLIPGRGAAAGYGAPTLPGNGGTPPPPGMVPTKGSSLKKWGVIFFVLVSMIIEMMVFLYVYKIKDSPEYIICMAMAIVSGIILIIVLGLLGFGIIKGFNYRKRIMVFMILLILFYIGLSIGTIAYSIQIVDKMVKDNKNNTTSPNSTHSNPTSSPIH